MNIKLQVIENLRKFQIQMLRFSYQGDIKKSPLYGQGLILSILKDTHEISRTELGDRMHMSRVAIAELLNKMESYGLITREQIGTDRRRYLIKLTELGKLAAEHSEKEKSILPTMLDALDGQELNKLNDYLDKILEYNSSESGLINPLSNNTPDLADNVVPPICEECPGPEQCKRDYLKYGHDRPNPEYCKYADQFPF